MTKKIDIKEVITEKDYFAFVKFPFSLYKNNPYWVPPLIKDEIETLIQIRTLYIKIHLQNFFSI